MANLKTKETKWDISKDKDALALIEELVGGLSLNQAAKAANVAYTTARRWNKTAEFAEYLDKERKVNRNADAPAVDRAVVEKAKSGDIPAARLFYEIKGEIGSREVNNQITVVFAAFDSIDRPKSFDATEVKVKSLTPIRAGE